MEFKVCASDLPTRLDTWLASKLDNSSRRSIQKIIDAGSVTINTKIAQKGSLLNDGNIIRLFEIPTTKIWFARPDFESNLNILYKDDHICIVDKPSGLPSVPLHFNESGTLAGAIAARFPQCVKIQRRPGDAGLIQRLDTQTSGVVIATLTEEAFEKMIRDQSSGTIEKTYLALIHRNGRSLPAHVSKPLGTFCGNPQKVTVVSNGTAANTDFSLVSEHGRATLVQAVISHGFRHQIRVHLACSGFPICGDILYNGPSQTGLNRLFLHASKVKFNHPITGKSIIVEAQLPKDLADIIY